MGEHMMDSQYSVNGDTVQAKITFVPRIEDNGMVLRCEARNDAIAEPVVNKLVLGVDRVTTTTSKPETTEKYEEEPVVHVEEKAVYDEYTNANRDYISNNELYPDYGYDDYASNWTQYNSIEDYHPEETDELTTSKPDIIIEELPSKSENSINTNIIHSNYQSKQTVDIIDDDPDIKVRSSEQYQEENRSGRNQDTSDAKLDAMESKKYGREIGSPVGSSAKGLGSVTYLTFAMTIAVLQLRLH